MTEATAKKLFTELLARFKIAFPQQFARNKVKLKIHAKHFLKSPKPRDFAWFDPVDNTVNITAKALKQDTGRITGLLAHELGHVADDNRHKPLSEARSDELAGFALGTPILYDADGVQSLTHGKKGRPPELHEAHGYRTVAAGLNKRMAQDGATHFAQKVDWVSEHIPEVTDPTKFVGWVTKEERVGGKLRNPKGNLGCNCGPCRSFAGKTQNPIRVKGGEPTYQYAKLVAQAYEDAPSADRAALPSYRVLINSVDDIYRQISSKVKIVHVTGQPYKNDRDMHDEVHRTRTLYISIDFNVHPFFTPAQNLRFRAVHDWFAHIAGGAPFEQRGELQAYNRQAKLTPPAGWPALFTEIVGQAMYATIRGTPEKPVFPEQKLAILHGFDLYNVGKLLPKGAKQQSRAKVRNGCGCGGTCGCG